MTLSLNFFNYNFSRHTTAGFSLGVNTILCEAGGALYTDEGNVVVTSDSKETLEIAHLIHLSVATIFCICS